MNNNPLFSTVTTLGILLAALTAGSTGVSAGELSEPSSDAVMQPVSAVTVLRENRDFVYPPGYMDRSPAQHRPIVQKFCVECTMDFSKAELFETRAAVVNFFKLSSPTAISIDSRDLAGEVRYRKPETVKTKKNENTKRWLTLHSL